MKTKRTSFLARAAMTLLLAVLTATTAWADNVLYATIDGTAMTLAYGEESSMPTGAIKYDAWYNWNSTFKGTITSVTIDASCSAYTGTTLEYLFYYCSELTTITNLSNLGTTNVTDMFDMFNGCSKLTSLDLSNFNTAAVTDMNYMFANCSSLTTLNLSSFNTAKVTDMRYMFDDCSELTSLNLSSFNTEKVTNMRNMFSGCSKLTSLNLSSFNTEKVTEMRNMFYGCSKLTSLDLSNFNTTNVMDLGMEGMFSGCSELTSLNLSNFNTAKVTSMSSMFYGCSKLTSLNLSNFNTAKVTYMSSMFYGCSELTSLNLSNFNTAKVTNMSSMFSGCTTLATIWVGPNWTNAAVTNKDNTFSGCTSLVGGNGTACDGSTNISADYAIVDIGTAQPGYLSAPKLLGDASGSTLTLAAGVPDGVKKTFTPGSDNWFGDASAKAAITSIVVDESCQNATALTSLTDLFHGFSAATSITGLENLNTENVTDMDDLFRGCAAVTLLDLSTWNTTNVMDYGMEGMFWDCTNLKTIIVADDWQASTGSAMLAGCSSLIGDAGNLCTLTDHWYQDYGYAHAGDGGYLTGATRTLTAGGPVDGKYYATFFNSAVGYTISGGTAYAGVYNSGNQKITLTSLGTDIPANTPVIIVADDATVNMTVNNTLAAYAGTNNLHGKDIQTNTADIKTELGDGTFYVLGNTNSHFGFHKYDGTTMPARKAFLLLNGDTALSLNIEIDDETTSIGASLNDKGEMKNDNFFDLSGRRVMNPTKGLYIVNGKKVVKR